MTCQPQTLSIIIQLWHTIRILQ